MNSRKLNNFGRVDVCFGLSRITLFLVLGARQSRSQTVISDPIRNETLKRV